MRGGRQPIFYCLMCIGCMLSITFAASVWAKIVPGTATGSGTVERLEYENGRISLKATAMPLLPLVEEVCKVTGIEIRTASPVYVDELVDADFKEMSLAAALRELLAGYNYMVMLGTEEGMAGMNLLAGGCSRPQEKKISRSIGFVNSARQGGLITGSAVTAATDRAGGAHGDKRQYRPAVPAARSGAVAAADRWPGKSSADSSRSGTRAVDGAGQGTLNNSANGDAEALQDYYETETGKDEIDAVEKAVALQNKKDRKEDYFRRQIEMLQQRIDSGVSDREYGYWSQRKDPSYLTHDRDLVKYYEKELEKLVLSSMDQPAS